MLTRRLRLAIRTIACAWATAAIVCPGGSAAVAADNDRWGANFFPNVTLTTQDGAEVRFYDDLVKGKIVAINLIYTTCKYACPLETARMAQVQKLLGDRVGRDVFFYSITIDPEHDTPAVLKEYSQKYQAGPGWLFLTGARADIEMLAKKLGIYSAPNAASADGHKPYLLVGNEATGQWMRNSAMDNPAFLARTIGDWLNSWQTARSDTTTTTSTEAPRISFDKGQYTFASRCAACHTIGRGDNIGPDLLGVTAARQRSWLTRFITAPDKMNADGDPIAVALRAKYNQARMPNLDLTETDAALVIDYIENQTRALPAARVPDRIQPAASPRRAGADLMPLLRPYFGVQRALNGDGLGGLRENAGGVASEALKLGSAGAAIGTAARTLQRAANLNAARAAFAELSDAILIYARETNGSYAANVKVAYCPMAGKYWLQEGEEIRNPFHGAEMSACGRLQEFRR